MPEIAKPDSFISQDVESSRLFFLDPIEERNFAVVFGGFERCEAGYEIDRENFPWYCLEFVSHGAGMLRLGGHDIELRPGSFFIYGPSQPHRIESSRDHPLGKYFVGFTGSDVAGFLESYDMPSGFSRNYPARCHRESLRGR